MEHSKNQSPQGPRVPTAFISYSWDSSEHKEWVLKLAEWLRGVGIDVSLDQWDLKPGDDIAAFMTEQLLSSDYVIMVCTDNYIDRAKVRSSGVAFEGSIIRSERASNIDTFRFIPIIRDNPDAKMPDYVLKTTMYVDFNLDSDLDCKREELARRIHNTPALKKPPLGTNPFSLSTQSTLTRFTDVPSFKHLLSSDGWFIEQTKKGTKGLVNSGLDAFVEFTFVIAQAVDKDQVQLFSAAQASQLLTFGWPIGLVLTDDFGPKPRNDGIGAEVVGKRLTRNSYDYWMIRNTGDFYSLISLFEDTRTTGSIFFDTRIVRTAEAFLYYFRLLQSLGVGNDPIVGIQILHRGLSGRTLLPASSQKWPIPHPKRSVENEANSHLVVNLGSLKRDLVDNVITVLAPLFMLFEFTEFPKSVYEKIIKEFAEPTKVRAPMKCGKCGEVVIYEIIAPLPGMEKTFEFICSSGHEMQNKDGNYEVVDLKNYDESKLYRVII
jgi:hypothetical protein